MRLSSSSSFLSSLSSLLSPSPPEGDTQSCTHCRHWELLSWALASGPRMWLVSPASHTCDTPPAAFSRDFLGDLGTGAVPAIHLTRCPSGPQLVLNELRATRCIK
ncbi:hypothetical protein GN956_G24915 [Arapaima gigas]